MSHISFVLLPLHYRYWMYAARSQNTFLIIFHINEKNGWTLYMLVAVNILLNLSCCHIPCKTICPTIKLYLTITKHLQKPKHVYISHFRSSVIWELYVKPFSISRFSVHHLADAVHKINTITYMLYSKQYSPISIIWIIWAIKGSCIFLQCSQKGIYELTRKYK